jgi:AraC-like DNA-binding protein
MRYREFPPTRELADLLVCTWERAVPGTGAPPPTRVLPDGCVDIVWRDPDLFVAGPDSGPYMSAVHPGATIVGLRLRPGIAGQALGLPASELRDARTSMEDVLGPVGAELAERISEAREPLLQRRVLERALRARRERAPAPDPLVLAAVRQLGRPGSRVGSLSSTLFTSERQLLRRFRTSVGYGPKTLDRVLRFQRFLSLASIPRGDRDGLARIAAELGYADQAHLSRECVQLSGLSPSRLVASIAS